MASTSNRKEHVSSRRQALVEKKLLAQAQKGDRKAFLQLFTAELPHLDRFIRHEIKYSESTGAVEQGLIDPCAILDQVYIAALNSLDSVPKATIRGWFRYLALHILRQQIRLEHEGEPAGLVIERPLPADGSIDTDLWEYYQPDDVNNVEDTVADRSAADPVSQVELQETIAEIEETIKELPPELRDLLMLRKIEGLSVQEIATLKGRPADEILQKVQEACEALRVLAAAREW